MPEFVTGKFEENLRVDEIPGSGIYLLKENYLGPNVWKSIYLSCLHENRFDLTYIGSYYFLSMHNTFVSCIFYEDMIE